MYRTGPAPNHRPGQRPGAVEHLTVSTLMLVQPATFEPSDGVAFALALLNTWDELEPDPECLHIEGFLGRFLTRHGLTDAARVAGDADIESLQSLRERLAHAWDAADEETAVAELNAILAGASAQPWLARRHDGSQFRYDRPGAPIRTFADALAARGLLEEIADGRWPRFGRCNAGPCRCVFVDRTRSGVRRYCCRLCADRAAHQAFRRRRRADA
jgi:predicted RNA-binding Zn ribbon-like protein